MVVEFVRRLRELMKNEKATMSKKDDLKIHHNEGVCNFKQILADELPTKCARSMSQQGLSEKLGRGLADSAGPSLRLSWAWVKWAFDSRAQSEQASYPFGQ